MRIFGMVFLSAFFAFVVAILAATVPAKELGILAFFQAIGLLWVFHQRGGEEARISTNSLPNFMKPGEEYIARPVGSTAEEGRRYILTRATTFDAKKRDRAWFLVVSDDELPARFVVARESSKYLFPSERFAFLSTREIRA